MNEQFGNHKDQKPEYTINRIRKILNNIGIHLYEHKWYQSLDNVFSVGIAEADNSTHSNGKGISKPYTLASAYAEYIERLQNGFLYKFTYGLMSADNNFWLDSEVFSTNSAYDSNEEIFNKVYKMDYKKVIEFYGDKMMCVPFYDIVKDDIKYLPYSLIASVSASNGLCAGNTPEEALVQGFCEIIERYILKILHTKQISLPTVPINIIQHMNIYRLIKKIQSFGYSIIIKDGSFGGIFPAIILILVNKNQTKYTFHIGVDPVLEVAIQRCITEIFQGSTLIDIEKTILVTLDVSDNIPEQENNLLDLGKNNDDKDFYRRFRKPGGAIYDNLLYHSNNSKFNWPLCTSQNNKSYLKKLIESINKSGYKNIYIRNVSFLGFPSYRIYIPGMSEINRELIYNEREIYTLCNNLLTLPYCTEKQIREIIKRMEHLLSLSWVKEEIDISKDLFLKNLFFPDMFWGKECSLVNINIYFFMSVLTFRIKDFRKAYDYYKLYLDKNKQRINNEKYAWAVLIYFKCKMNKLNDKEIINKLSNIYSNELANEVVNDLNNPEDALKYLVLPNCGNCKKCDIVKYCNYDKWKNITTNMMTIAKENPINQKDLKFVIHT